jgi:hypothetical protein
LDGAAALVKHSEQALGGYFTLEMRRIVLLPGIERSLAACDGRFAGPARYDRPAGAIGS